MSHSARAAVMRRHAMPMTIEDIEIDEPKGAEVVVDIVATGVCHTDMVMRDGALPVPVPVILGHEGAGRVVAVGADVKSLELGDAVVLTFDSCGACPSCAAHLPSYCHAFFPKNFFGLREDGSTAIRDAKGEAVHSFVFGQSTFATKAIAHERNAVKVDANLPLELLGPFGCGIQTGAVGLSGVMAARIAGAERIVAIDRNRERLALAEELGATQALHADGRPINELLACAGFEAVDFAVDTTGLAAVVEQLIEALAPRGEVALVGAYAPEPKISFDATHIMSSGRVIRGIVECAADPQQFIPELIGYYRAGKLPVEKIVKFFAFDDLLEAIEAGECGRVVKPIVKMS